MANWTHFRSWKWFLEESSHPFSLWRPENSRQGWCWHQTSCDNQSSSNILFVIPMTVCLAHSFTQGKAYNNITCMPDAASLATTHQGKSKTSRCLPWEMLSKKYCWSIMPLSLIDDIKPCLSISTTSLYRLVGCWPLTTISFLRARAASYSRGKLQLRVQLRK